MDTLVLRRGHWVLELAPEVGGSIAAFQGAPAGSQRMHWLRPASRAALRARDPLGMASFPLLPWCNRLREGRARACGREIALPPDPLTPHTLHGLAWRRPWRVREVQAHRATLEFSFEGEGRPGWPWSFEARQTYTVQEAGLDVDMALHNRSTGPMPYGLGHHPFFVHAPGTWLQCRVQAMWANDAQRLPTGLVQPDFLPRLSHGLVLDELDLDHNFVGWDHGFTVRWPGRTHQLVLRAQPPLDFFVLYCPRGADHFCAEPVSNCSDWLNLQDPDRRDCGGGVLAPGECVQTAWSIRIEALA